MTVNGANFANRKWMHWLGAAGALAAFVAIRLSAQAPPPVHLTAEQDHQRLMDLLHITSLRRGADGDPKSPYAANYDEAKATLSSKLPDPLKLNNGKEVKTAKVWWQKRRPEIVEDFDREIYGRVPKETPKVVWEVTSTAHEINGDVPVITKKLVGHVDNSAYPAIAGENWFDRDDTRKRAGASAGNHGAELQPGSYGRHREALSRIGRCREQRSDMEAAILAKGWGYAVLIPTSMQADNGAGLTEGIIGLVNKGQPRRLDDWGAIARLGVGREPRDGLFRDGQSSGRAASRHQGHSRFGKSCAGDDGL